MNRVYALRPEIATMFDRVFTSEDYCESKPSPDCFITAARYFGFEPGQCVVAEDSINGLKESRRGLELSCWGFPRPTRPKPLGNMPIW